MQIFGSRRDKNGNRPDRIARTLSSRWRRLVVPRQAGLTRRRRTAVGRNQAQTPGCEEVVRGPAGRSPRRSDPRRGRQERHPRAIDPSTRPRRGRARSRDRSLGSIDHRRFNDRSITHVGHGRAGLCDSVPAPTPPDGPTPQDNRVAPPPVSAKKVGYGSWVSSSSDRSAQPADGRRNPTSSRLETGPAGRAQMPHGGAPGRCFATGPRTAQPSWGRRPRRPRRATGA